MNKLTALLCVVSLAVGSSVDGQSLSAYSGLANKIQQILQNNRQSFADGFEGLPSLDPISIPESFDLNAEPFTATVSDITVTGLSSFSGTSLSILSNGVFLFAVAIPQVAVQGKLVVPVSQVNYTGSLRTTFSNVMVVINGFVSVSNDLIAIDEIHTDVSITEVPTVKVLGLPGVLNQFVSQYFTSDLGNLINNDSGIYEAGLNNVVSTYLKAALGNSYSKFVNKVNSLA